MASWPAVHHAGSGCAAPAWSCPSPALTHTHGLLACRSPRRQWLRGASVVLPLTCPHTHSWPPGLPFTTQAVAACRSMFAHTLSQRAVLPACLASSQRRQWLRAASALLSLPGVRRCLRSPWLVHSLPAPSFPPVPQAVAARRQHLSRCLACSHALLPSLPFPPSSPQAVAARRQCAPVGQVPGAPARRRRRRARRVGARGRRVRARLRPPHHGRRRGESAPALHHPRSCPCWPLHRTPPRVFPMHSTKPRTWGSGPRPACRRFPPRGAQATLAHRDTPVASSGCCPQLALRRLLAELEGGAADAGAAHSAAHATAGTTLADPLALLDSQPPPAAPHLAAARSSPSPPPSAGPAARASLLPAAPAGRGGPAAAGLAAVAAAAAAALPAASGRGTPGGAGGPRSHPLVLSTAELLAGNGAGGGGVAAGLPPHAGTLPAHAGGGGGGGYRLQFAPGGAATAVVAAQGVYAPQGYMSPAVKVRLCLCRGHRNLWRGGTREETLTRLRWTGRQGLFFSRRVKAVAVVGCCVLCRAVLRSSQTPHPPHRHLPPQQQRRQRRPRVPQRRPGAARLAPQPARASGRWAAASFGSTRTRTRSSTPARLPPQPATETAAAARALAWPRRAWAGRREARRVRRRRWRRRGGCRWRCRRTRRDRRGC